MIETFASLFSAKPVLVGLHLGFAIAGIDLTLWLWGELVARSENRRRIATVASFAFVSYLMSWIVGGYYYVTTYGSIVKPIIKAGSAPWAHAVIMETKEHVFLFLIPLALTILFLAFLSRDGVDAMKLRSAFKTLVVLAAFLGMAVGAMGFVISAAARWAS